MKTKLGPAMLLASVVMLLPGCSNQNDGIQGRPVVQSRTNSTKLARLMAERNELVGRLRNIEVEKASMESLRDSSKPGTVNYGYASGFLAEVPRTLSNLRLQTRYIDIEISRL